MCQGCSSETPPAENASTSFIVTRSGGTSGRVSNGGRNQTEESCNDGEELDERSAGSCAHSTNNDSSAVNNNSVFGDDDMLAAGDGGSISDRESSHDEDESLLSQPDESLDEDCDNNEDGDYDEEEEEENDDERISRGDWRQSDTARTTRSGCSSHKDEENEAPAWSRLLVSTFFILYVMYIQSW